MFWIETLIHRNHISFGILFVSYFPFVHPSPHWFVTVWHFVWPPPPQFENFHKATRADLENAYKKLCSDLSGHFQVPGLGGDVVLMFIRVEMMELTWGIFSHHWGLGGYVSAWVISKWWCLLHVHMIYNDVKCCIWGGTQKAVCCMMIGELILYYIQYLSFMRDYGRFRPFF